MDERFVRANSLLTEFKGDDYVHGLECFDGLGALVKALGSNAAVVTDGIGAAWATPIHDRTRAALSAAGVTVAGELIPGADPNAPREDVRRIADAIAERNADVVVAVGGGSAIDATKAATAMNALGEKHPDIEEYFGVGKVSAMLEADGASMKPLVAVQLAASSGAHLTKYSNVTDMGTHQKKLIVDDAVVPRKALFDYAMTTSMPRGFTADGGLDGIAHCLEVFYGLKGEALEKARPVALLGIDIIVNYIKRACDNPKDLEAREALGLGTDLGGYAIMIGGTNGAHLTSFSLVDILSHGRACALMNPYYTVFFAPAIEDQLHAIGDILKRAGYTKASVESLSGRDLGIAVAEGMLELSRAIDFPTTLAEVDGFTKGHIDRALTAAKNPQLDMKLKNMPVPLSAELVDDYMGPILEAAETGDFGRIKTMA
ncbi:MAG: iron-containing alcohol dehydrogenase [Chitinivibrionales bacterium]|nr:iron-containing alcohol dehydrogenase [Chitinivibrionales bacterium]